jgi:hypothetical protein
MKKGIAEVFIWSMLFGTGQRKEGFMKTLAEFLKASRASSAQSSLSAAGAGCSLLDIEPACNDEKRCWSSRRPMLVWSLKQKTRPKACLVVQCPFADLFRTTFPEIRGNRAQKDYLFTNLIEN